MKEKLFPFSLMFTFELNIPTPKLFLIILKARSGRNIVLERPGI